MAEIIARRYGSRYAKALFELAKEDGASGLDVIRKEAEALGALWAENAELRAIMDRPDITAGEKKEIWKAVLNGEFSRETEGTVLLLTDKGRLAYLPEILEMFEEFCREESREATAYVETASPLSDEEAAQLKASLERILGKTITLDITVDETLLGGLRVRVGDKLFDSTLKSRLAALKERLLDPNGSDPDQQENSNTEVKP